MKYRLLITNEIIEPSDEWLDHDCINWRSVSAGVPGMPYRPGVYMPFRRPIKLYRPGLTSIRVGADYETD